MCEAPLSNEITFVESAIPERYGHTRLPRVDVEFRVDAARSSIALLRSFGLGPPCWLSPPTRGFHFSRYTTGETLPRHRGFCTYKRPDKHRRLRADHAFVCSSRVLARNFVSRQNAKVPSHRWLDVSCGERKRTEVSEQTPDSPPNCEEGWTVINSLSGYRAPTYSYGRKWSTREPSPFCSPGMFWSVTRSCVYKLVQ